MGPDQAMWATTVLADHLREGADIEDACVAQVGRALAMLLDFCNWDTGEYWNRFVTDADRTQVAVLLQRATGRLVHEVRHDLEPHLNFISDALDSRSWQRIRDLPDPVWRYLSALTGASKAEWDELPDYCRAALGELIRCPNCDRRARIKDYGPPDEVSDPFLLEIAPFYALGSRIWLIFHCPDCGSRITYDVMSGAATDVDQPLHRKSKLYRYLWYLIAAVVAVTILRVLMR